MIHSNWLKSFVLLHLFATLYALDNFAHQFPVIREEESEPGKNETKKSHQDEIDILPPHYYREVAPRENGQPVVVQVSVVVLNLKLSSGSDQNFDADIFFHNFWTDKRLQKPSNADMIAQRIKLSADESLPQYRLGDSWRKRLWIPDMYFRNAESGSISNIITPTYYFTVTNYVNVFMAVRLRLRLTCDMNFVKYPFDTQTCFINITTTVEDTDTLQLVWNTFRMGSHVDVSEFTILSVDKRECVKYLDIGRFSCLYGKFVIKRNMGNYLIKRFIPSFIIVSSSFIGFWIPTAISPARSTLSVTALLAMITQQIQSDLNVSYVYALQVWNIVCIIFVFANLAEFALAMYVMHAVQKRVNRQMSIDPKFTEMGLANGGAPRPEVSTVWQHHWRRIKHRLRMQFRTNTQHSSVDIIARYLIPPAYFAFVIVFALYCIAQ